MLLKAIFYFYVLLSLFQGPFFSKNSFGYPLFFRRVLKLCMFLLNVECDEFVLRGRSASPFMNPFFTPGVKRLRLIPRFCDFGISSTFDAVLRYLPIFFFAVLRYLSIFSAVLRCSAPPNVPS